MIKDASQLVEDVAAQKGWECGGLDAGSKVDAYVKGTRLGAGVILERYDGPGCVAGDIAADAGHGGSAGQRAQALGIDRQLGEGIMEQGSNFSHRYL